MDTSRDSGTRVSLPVELHAAARERHRALNAAIIARLPLSLPPIVDSPYLYAKGMVVFGQIYFAFESFLTRASATSHLDQRLVGIYTRLHLPALARTQLLQGDLASLKSRFTGAGELDSLAEASKLYHSQIEASLREKPHVLLAYAWTMYLALFNGGRWIRGQLVSAGSEFWRGEPFPLSFWELGDRLEEEELKATFKEEFLVAASLLTDDEKDEVIEETNRLFDMCSEMVRFLDTTTTNLSKAVASAKPVTLAYSLTRNHLGASSIIVALWQGVVTAYESLKATVWSTWESKVA